MDIYSCLDFSNLPFKICAHPELLVTARAHGFLEPYGSNSGPIVQGNISPQEKRTFLVLIFRS